MSSFDVFIKEVSKRATPDDDWLLDENVCRRFLTGWKNDSDAALRQILETSAWRKKWAVGDVLTHELSEREKLLDEYMPIHLTRFEGKPCVIGSLARTDFAGLEKEFTETELLQHTILTMERRMALGPNIQATIVVDLGYKNGAKTVIRGPVSATRWVAAAKRCVKKQNLDRHYPECVSQIYVMNSPKALASLWTFAALIFDPVTVKKIKFDVPSHIQKFASDIIKTQKGGGPLKSFVAARNATTIGDEKEKDEEEDEEKFGEMAEDEFGAIVSKEIWKRQ